MKIRVLIIVLSVLLLLTSCSSDISGDVPTTVTSQDTLVNEEKVVPEHQVYLEHPSDRPSPFGLEKSDTSDLSKKTTNPYQTRYDRVGASAQMQLEYNGCQYLVDYDYSIDCFGDFSCVDYYRYGDDMHFGVDTNTGEIVRFYKTYDEDEYYREMLENNRVIYDEITLESKMYDFLEQKVDNLAFRYTLIKTDMDICRLENSRKIVGYTFYLSNMERNIKTSDTISLRITVFGDITYFELISMGTVDKSKCPSEKDIISIRSEIDEKMNKFLGEYYPDFEYYIVEEEKEFRRINADEYALVFHIIHSTKGGGSQSFLSHEWMVVYF